MNYLIIDTEFTVGSWKKGEGGDPFNPRNRLCLVGTCNPNGDLDCMDIEYSSAPYGDELRRLQAQIDSAETLVLFNAKRDLHWLRRYGIRFAHRKVWDIQIGHFIKLGQSNRYPSLNDVGEYYNLGQKDDTIERDYLANKIDIPDIPLPVLDRYLRRDLILSRGCYLRQLDDLNDRQKCLVRLQGLDLLILEEMEWNGIPLNVNACEEKAIEVRSQIESLDTELTKLTDSPFPINWNSDDHLSALLYGGTLSYVVKVEDGVFKTGKKAGQAKYKNQICEVTFPRLVNPLEGTELLKDGFWSTSEPILQQLKAYGKAKRIIAILLERAKLEKLVSSYYEGLPNAIRVQSWANNTLHGTLNQCVAATGRLSSSKPNMQNNPPEINLLFESRYD